MRFTMRCLEWILLITIPATMYLSAQTEVTEVVEHWSPYNYPMEIPAGVKFHIVVEGDTLWDITATYLGDPLLWPQVYAKNAYILDSDLIYSGDPILLDVGLVVTDASIDENEGADPDATMPDQDTPPVLNEMAEEDDSAMMDDDQQGVEDISNVSDVTSFDSDSTEFVILPAGDRSDMECSSYLYQISEPDELLPFDFKIAGGENRHSTHFAPSEILYLNKGHDDGIKAGQIYSIRRVLSDVYNPEKRFLGKAIDQVGKLKILATQAMGSTAEMLFSCFDASVGDFLVPYEQIPIPLITELPILDRFASFETVGFGYIVLSEDNLASFGKGHVVNIDMGVDKNIAPGDLFTIYRDNPANDVASGMILPNLFLGHGVALKTGSSSTVMKIIAGVTEITVGDKIVPIDLDIFSE